MSSDNKKHAISSRRGIEVVCKGDTRVFDASEILQFEHAILLLHMRFCLHQKKVMDIKLSIS